MKKAQAEIRAAYLKVASGEPLTAHANKAGLGDSLGRNTFKKRVACGGRGKSGGFRLVYELNLAAGIAMQLLLDIRADLDRTIAAEIEKVRTKIESIREAVKPKA